MAEGDPGFAEIVRGHFDVHFVADADADEVLAHFAGDMGEDFVAIGKGDAEHGTWENLRDRADQFDWIFFRHSAISCCYLVLPLRSLKINLRKFLQNAMDNSVEAGTVRQLYEEQSTQERAGVGADYKSPAISLLPCEVCLSIQAAAHVRH